MAKVSVGGNSGEVTLFVLCARAKVIANDNTAVPGGDTADFTITEIRRGEAKCKVFEKHVWGYKFNPGDCKSIVVHPGDELACTVTNIKHGPCHDRPGNWWKHFAWHPWHICDHDDDD